MRPCVGFLVALAAGWRRSAGQEADVLAAAAVVGDPSLAPAPIGKVREGQGFAGPANLFDAPDEDYDRVNQVQHLMHDPWDGFQPLKRSNAGDFSEGDEDVDNSDFDYYVDEWAEHMDDFHPDMLVTFRLPARSEEFFYQEVGEEPTLIRGGYFVAEDKGSSPVKFDIIDPAGGAVLKKLRSESLFHFVTDKPGIYTFLLANTNLYHDAFVTLVLGAGNETSLTAEQLRSAADNVVATTRMVRDIRTESNYLWGRQNTHMQRVASVSSRLLWLAALELATVLCTVAAQVYLMKGFVSNSKSYRVIF